MGWNVLMDAELAREGTVWMPGVAGGNASFVPVGLGNLSLDVLDTSTLRLTLPVIAPYAILAPETVEVVVPAAALTSASDDLHATPVSGPK